ncbi:MAG: bifunctional diaminohydroxyphosphoribosylaminopyrimidine deaminase/5-amino-6-(5-phosphoribosylamino)uracil reductase RibD [Thermoleophilia bacterium]|nr:bifunctional diaminohydroxyphosphoribosylaminopyrimidine deaminase/5-amino-6-(5-phosphoribosylamino)uracil reductase RibD [Thermoleophilia bacterium]
MKGDGIDCMGAASLPRTDDPVDRAMLDKSIELAELGRPGARPNPVVGAVLAQPDGTVIGTGHHVRKGAAHAERALLEDLEGAVPDNATLYVSLEPCSHHGSTPPCTDIIIERGVRRVVYASSDANLVTAGMGPARMRAAGIEVLRAPLDIERRALQQNAGFHSVHLRGRAYLTAKWAMTRNGRFATGDPDRRWISGPESREFVHYLRAGSGAIAVGIGTVLADDPLLTVRGPLAARTPVPPLRVVYDRRLRLPLQSQLVQTIDDAPVLVICAHDAPADAELALVAAGVGVWRAPECGPGDLCIGGSSLAMLAERGINDVLCEAGPTLLSGFHEAELLDALHCYVAPIDAPEDQPGLALDHPLIREALDTPAAPSGDDEHHCVVLHPVWTFPGATAD